MTEITKTREDIDRMVVWLRDNAYGYFRHDLDAVDNGWDYMTYPDSGYLWEGLENMVRSESPDFDAEISDDTRDLMVDATLEALGLI